VVRILSGIQPSGELHLGNYLGALRHWVKLQETAECFYLIADLHAITAPADLHDLASRTQQTVALLLAIGIDIQRSPIFVQSQISAHAELAWILNCFTGYGELQRMTQFKDKATQAATLGLFAYPVLQAADILLYQANQVPVGEDQQQHLELTRTLARRFNGRFGATFQLPKPLIAPAGARIMDLQQPQTKMSKSSRSAEGTIRLLDAPEVIRSKVRAAVTDSGHELKAAPDKPAISNLLSIYSIVAGTTVTRVEQQFAHKSYAQFKRELADLLVEVLLPIQTRYTQIIAAPDEIARGLHPGAERARKIAAETLALCYSRIGVLQS
jgi:tryptophanyl-tRNA synthetase